MTRILLIIASVFILSNARAFAVDYRNDLVDVTEQTKLTNQIPRSIDSEVNQNTEVEVRKLIKAIPYFTYAQNTDVISYEPYTKTVHIPYHTYYSKDKFPDNSANYHIRSLIAHGNNVKNLKITTKQISEAINGKKIMPMMYSMAVLNKNKSTDTADLNYATCYFGYDYQEENKSYSPSGLMSVSVVSSGETENFDYAFPKFNNPDKDYKYGLPKVGAFYKDDKEYAFFYSKLNQAKQNTVQYGMYGSGVIDVSTIDIQAANVKTDWFDELLKPGAKNSTYWSQSAMDADEEGTLYVACLNNKKDEDLKEVPRKVMVQSSSDMGKTWSKFNVCPLNIVVDYLVKNNFDGAVKFNNGRYGFPFSKRCFVVTGKDSYSYFTPLYVTKSPNKADIHLVEIFYKAQTWGIRKVAELNSPYGSNPESSNFMKIREVGTTGLKDSIIHDANLSMEIQVAKVHESNDLLVKWIDYRKDKAHVVVEKDIILNEQNRFNKGEKIYAIDVFTSSRAANGSKWSMSKNVTEDPKRINRLCHLPKIIPSLNNYPLLMITKTDAGSYFNPKKDPNGFRSDYPMILFDLCDLELKDVSLYWPPDCSVGGNISNTLNVTIDNIYPNPVSVNNLNIEYTIKKCTDVTINIVDALGNTIKTILNSQALQPGSQSINDIEISELSTGVYYLSLISGGHSISKMFTVIR